MCISRQILFQTLTYHGLFQNKGNLNLISILRIHLCNVDFRSALMHMLHVCSITYKVRSENGYGYLRPGLKKGVGNGIFGSENWVWIWRCGRHTPTKHSKEYPPGGNLCVLNFVWLLSMGKDNRKTLIGMTKRWALSSWLLNRGSPVLISLFLLFCSFSP